MLGCSQRRLLEHAFAALRRGGRLVCEGLPPETDGPMSLPIFQRCSRASRSSAPSLTPGRRTEVFDLHAHDARVVAETRTLDEVNEAIDEVLTGRSNTPWS
jgi:propanol-preferring alcohol dehydrogenase